MPEAWRPRLRHRFGHPDAMARLLDRLTATEAATISMQPGGEQALVDYVTEQMLAAGFNPEAGRRPEEVAARYAEKLALAAAHVPPETVDLMRLYLSIEGPAAIAFDEVEALGAHYCFDLAAPLAALRRHEAMLAALAPEAEVRFDASFSPRLDYYTGIVFEMLSPTGAVLASGGQYDRLLQLLGADRPVAASGCAVWVNRLEQEFGG
jgi:ATP phosphoribosyltransferase regulatory subunit